MVEHCVGQDLDNTDEPTRGYESVATLISRVREARRDGEVVRMAELARETASVLGPSMAGGGARTDWCRGAPG
ncbi:hypothetical protein [Streptomyces sp. NBC_00140]|uniref:hypothetical protein n=1 Tax=Streptomyces sp. NBC_00140 TaxID=2975664 RepID=UPI00224D9131|nr:hypothetical protein [Streptomyces sp. NBC_00140]MCX5336615.1 hypothetical protein [Streptomyces sp. NBC_00140]